MILIQQEILNWKTW